MIVNKPHWVFALFSLITGFLLVFLMTPIGGIDENQHVSRVVDIAAFKLLNPSNDTEDPLAIWSENALVLQSDRVALSPRWDFWDMFRLEKELPKTLPEDRQVMMDKNPYAVSNPLMYVPFSLALHVSYLFDAEPWQQFYIIRIAGLICSVSLIAWAIARMPEHKSILAALCLLPAMMNSRSGVNIDGMVIGVTFLFISQVFRLKQKEYVVKGKDITFLVIFGFLLAQSKSAYIPILFLSLLIPVANFQSRFRQCMALFLTIIPAIIVGMGWSAMAKNVILSGISYYNDNGRVWPDGQFEWIVNNVFDYLLVLLRTIFTSPLIPMSLIEAIGYIGWGHNFIAIPAIGYVILIVLSIAIMATEPVNIQLEEVRIKRWFIILIIFSSVCLALTMLYVQWSAYQAPVIKGFQGRYLYPLLPLFVLFVKPDMQVVGPSRSIMFLWLFALVSSGFTIWSTINFYYL